MTENRAGPRLVDRHGGLSPPAAANTSTSQAYESLSRIEEVEARTLYFGHGDPSTQGTRAIVAEARSTR